MVDARKRRKLQADEGPGGRVRFDTGLSFWSWSGQDIAAADVDAALATPAGALHP